MSFFLILASILCFLLVTFGAAPGNLDAHELTALGLAFFAIAHLPIDGYINSHRNP